MKIEKLLKRYRVEHGKDFRLKGVIPPIRMASSRS